MFQQTNKKHLLLQCNSLRISLFKPKNLSLQYSAPKFSKYIPSFSRIHSPWLHPLPALFLPLSFSSCTQTSFLELLSPTHTNFLPLDCLYWLTLFPKLILLNPHVTNNFGTWPLTPTLLHVFNDWIWEHSIRNGKIHIQIEDLGKWDKLIYMGIYLLDPSWPLS